MSFSHDSIALLRGAGLLLDGPYDAEDLVAPNGYMVVKPASAGGNALPGANTAFIQGSSRVVTDAPPGHLYFDGSMWHFRVWERAPGPGPGDFNKAFKREEAAVQFVLEYYFGETAEFVLKRRPGTA